MKGHSDGITKTEAVWQTREAKINSDTATNIAAANKRVSDNEHAHAQQIAAVDTSYQTKLQEKSRALQTALANLHKPAGGLFSHSPACPAPAGHAPSSVAAAPGERDGASGRQLLGSDDTVFLLTETSRADQIVEQLTACRGVVLEDRTTK